LDATTPNANIYRGFIDLAAAQTENEHFRVVVRRIDGSKVAIIAPHGGRIEQYTSEIARQIAGEDFNLYLLEGIRRAGNYCALHLTSHLFDDPRCLDLLARCDRVVAIHGCQGGEQSALIGGRDDALAQAVKSALIEQGIHAQLGDHQFPAKHPNNMCNRRRTGAGVQLELTIGFRLKGSRETLAETVRSVLLAK
jgi:phage replication-related protein YjqB (UPF0714/DUF867 family)